MPTPSAFPTRHILGSTPFHLAVQNTGRGGSSAKAARTAQREILQAFLKHAVSPALANAKGKSVLEWAKSDSTNGRGRRRLSGGRQGDDSEDAGETRRHEPLTHTQLQVVAWCARGSVRMWRPSGSHTRVITVCSGLPVGNPPGVDALGGRLIT